MKKIIKKMCGGIFSFLKLAGNGFGLGEVAEPKIQIEKQNLIIKNKC